MADQPSSYPTIIEQQSYRDAAETRIPIDEAIKRVEDPYLLAELVVPIPAD